MRVAPSIIAANFAAFQEEIKKIEHAKADLLHLDVMDGVFVPNLTFGPMVVEAINSVTEMELDAHLMIIKPDNYIEQFLDAGADWISFHCEATEKTEVCIERIQSRNKKAGLAINPSTPFAEIEKYVERLDYLLIMTVEPGFYGQKFMAGVLKKVKEAKDYIDSHQLNCILEVDGGINFANACAVKDAGADIIVAGAGVFKQDNYAEAIESLRCSKV
ncbi:MAG: ribulose-phosphate 3-epimerase [bacterium]